MLDIALFRDAPERIRADHDRRGLPHDAIDEVIRLDGAWRDLLKATDVLRAERNQAARAIGAAKKAGNQEEMQRVLAEVASIGERITSMEKEVDEALAARDAVRMSIPNLLHEAVPSGADESGNTVHSVHGEKPTFAFEPRTHNDLIEMNRWVDLERAAKVTGSRFYYLKGDLARMEMALSAYAVDFLRERGYTFVQPPVMMNRTAYEGVTDLGDFETVMYGIEPDGYYMTATSEHPLTAMYMGETVPEEHLPLRLVGVSDCFRREVGAHGQSDRGIWRVHQFRKVEQIVISDAEGSWDLHEELLQNCIDLWDALGPPLRSGQHLHRRHGHRGQPQVRPRSVVAWRQGVQGGRVLLQLHGLPGQPLADPHRRARPRQPAHRPHAEFHGRGHQPRAGRHHGAEPTRGRARAGARRAAALHGRSGRARILRLLSGFTRER